jgi:membrane-associated phospholipid phosphatase
VINLLDFDGVVNFPSFHCCMALLTAYVYRGMARISGFVYAFSGLVIVSCVPIGGHYLSDIVAGAAVWGAFVVMTRLRSRVAPHGQANTSAARAASREATPEQLATR